VIDDRMASPQHHADQAEPLTIGVVDLDVPLAIAEHLARQISKQGSAGFREPRWTVSRATRRPRLPIFVSPGQDARRRGPGYAAASR
jgi:hypothetical protein